MTSTHRRARQAHPVSRATGSWWHFITGAVCITTAEFASPRFSNTSTRRTSPWIDPMDFLLPDEFKSLALALSTAFPTAAVLDDLTRLDLSTPLHDIAA